MTRARDLADSADKDIAGTLTLDGLTVDASGTPASLNRTDGNAALLELKTSGSVRGYIGADTTGSTVFYSGAAAERMRIDSSGNVGIGTSSPSAKLDISQPSASTGLEVYVNDIGTSKIADLKGYDNTLGVVSRMVVQANGNVGIGTSSPTGKLSVSDPTYLSSTATLGSSITLNSENTASWLGTRELISLESVGNGADHRIGTLSVKLKKGASDTTLTEYMQINAVSNYTTFSTAGSERMRIDSSGRVGIGTTTPTEALTVSGGNIQVDSFSRKIGFKVSGNSNAGYLIPYDGSGNTQLVNERSSGNLIFKTANTEALRITSGGGLNLGTTGLPTSGNAGVSLQPAGNVHCGVAGTSATDVMRFDNPNGRIGSITVTGTTTSYNTSSDYRLKENVTDVTDGITRVKQLAPKRFNFIADPDTTVDGFIAHEVQDVIPEAISGAKDAMRDEEYKVTPAVLDDDGNVVTEAVMGTRSVPDYQGIDQSKLVPLLTAALQEAIAKIETLETKVAALEGA